MKSYGKWLWIGGGLLVLAVLLMWLGNNSSSLSGSTDEMLAVTEADWTRGGGADAPVTLIEYGDFQCPACGAYYPLTHQLEMDFGTQLRFVFRHFPLLEVHPNAIPGALAVEAAGKQGKFWEMYDKLYQSQAEWGESPDAKSKFAEYAVTLGLNKDQFIQDEDSADLLAKVKQSRSNSEKLGLNGTPSFFLNGKKIENPTSYPAFRELLEAAGAKAVNASTTPATTGSTTAQ